MRLIRKSIIVLIVLLTSCTSDKKELEISNKEKYNWEIKIFQSGSYDNFTKAIAVDGDDEFDWFYNDEVMELVQFDNNLDTIILTNGDYKYSNIELDFIYYTNTTIDTMNLSVEIYRDDIMIENIDYEIEGDFEEKIKI